MLRYLVGDLLEDLNDRELTVHDTVLVHICNDIGVFGGGFTYPLNKYFPKNTADYKEFVQLHHGKIPQGQVLFHYADTKTTIANCIAQVGVIGPANPKPFNPTGLRTCLEQVNARTPSRIVMPRIGCKLAGAQWSEIEPIIKETIHDSVLVDVFTLPQEMKDFDIVAGTLIQIKGLDFQSDPMVFMSLVDEKTAKVYDGGKCKHIPLKELKFKL